MPSDWGQSASVPRLLPGSGWLESARSRISCVPSEPRGAVQLSDNSNLSTLLSGEGGGAGMGSDVSPCSDRGLCDSAESTHADTVLFREGATLLSASVTVILVPLPSPSCTTTASAEVGALTLGVMCTRAPELAAPVDRMPRWGRPSPFVPVRRPLGLALGYCGPARHPETDPRAGAPERVRRRGAVQHGPARRAYERATVSRLHLCEAKLDICFLVRRCCVFTLNVTWFKMCSPHIE